MTRKAQMRFPAVREPVVNEVGPCCMCGGPINPDSDPYPWEEGAWALTIHVCSPECWRSWQEHARKSMANYEREQREKGIWS